MDTQVLVSALKARPNMTIAAPVIDEDIQAFMGRFGETVDSQLLTVWKAFDGFEDGGGLLIRLWPLKEIATYYDDRDVPAGYCAFADELLWCEAYFFSPYDLSQPVLLCYGKFFRDAEIIAANFWDFLEQMADGRDRCTGNAPV